MRLLAFTDSVAFLTTLRLEPSRFSTTVGEGKALSGGVATGVAVAEGGGG